MDKCTSSYFGRRPIKPNRLGASRYLYDVSQPDPLRDGSSPRTTRQRGGLHPGRPAVPPNVNKRLR